MAAGAGCDYLAGETDFMLRCLAPDLPAFQEFVTRELTAAPNVATVKTFVSIRSVKREPGMPMGQRRKVSCGFAISSTRRWSSCPSAPHAERDRRAAAGEDAVVAREIADEVEMRGEARVGQHLPGVAADREHLAALDGVVLVEHEHVLGMRDAALVDDGLAVVLAQRLEIIELEQAVGGGEEFRRRRAWRRASRR